MSLRIGDWFANLPVSTLGVQLRALSRRHRSFLGLCGVCTALVACSDETHKSSGDTIRIGAILPFTGKEAAIGRNLEQAMLLAVEDVNNAGGIDGVPLELVARDSNSGSERGQDELRRLLYDDEIKYLVGPEENELSNQFVKDIKALDILNVLPGYAAPGIKRSSATGAWLRLAPLPYSTACAFSGYAIDEGAQSANTLATVEDYNSTLATDFTSQMRRLTQQTVSSVKVQPSQSSYVAEVKRVFGYDADRTMLVAYPTTAATIITEWDVLGGAGSWYLSPLLHAETFLLNVPYGSLEGAFGMSPSLSLSSECEMLEGEAHGAIACSRDNARQFRSHFAERWDGTKPFAAAHLYYDAIVLLAFGLQYGVATTGEIPSPRDLQRIVRELNQGTNEVARWSDLSSELAKAAQGIPLRLIGAGAEYTFDPYGAADHRVFDTWEIRHHEFQNTGAYYAYCIPPL
ncbi:MAG TPA: ABC transporter substrate-binding protein [Polyangiaceae bacterium]|nr:ABC transporter substrate-binding protein [Polyangiaceae bacterium]